MDIALRILHIVFGIFWAGTNIFATLILLPQLRKLGPDIERPTMKALMRVANPFIMASAIIMLGTGIAMALRMQGSLSAYFSTGWGIVMFISFVAILIVLIISFGIMAPVELRMNKLVKATEGWKPTAEENREIEQLTARSALLERINLGMILIAVFAMPIARFV